MRRLLAWLIVLLPFAATAQSVQQSGRVTPGHPTMWTTDGVVQDAGTSSQGKLTTLGITSSNLQSQCINNGPATGPYNSLCFGINGTQAQITLSNFGGAPPIPLQCVVNGVTSNCLTEFGSFLPLAGGTLSGPLILSADPTLNLGAATKHYVDTSPPFGGPFLPLTGGTLTGPLILSGDPTLSLGAATKHYVDTSLPVGGPFLPLAGGTLTGGLTVSAGGAGVTGGLTTDTLGATGNATVGGTLGITGATTFGGTFGAAPGTNITLNLGGATHTLIIAGNGGTGNIATLTANAGAHVVDLTVSAGTELKTYYQRINSAVTWSGAYSADKSPLSMVLQPTGTVTPTAGNFQFMQWIVNNDTVNAGTSTALNVLDFEDNVGGAAMTGSRSIVKFNMNQTATSGNGSSDVVYQAGQAGSNMNHNEGGSGLTSSTALGHNYAWSEIVRLQGTATNFYANKAKEINLSMAAGTSALKNIGIDVIPMSTHRVQGAYYDYAFGVQSQPGAAVGMKRAFQFGAFDGQDPFGANSAIMEWVISGNPLVVPPQLAFGIDLSLGTIAGNAWTSRDFSVSGTGDVSIHQSKISAVAGGILFDVPNYTITYSSIGSGGTANVVGDYYKDATSGLVVSPTTIGGGGVVTAATQINGGYQPSAAGGPITVTNMNVDRSGLTFTVNVTSTLNGVMNFGTTSATAINIGRSGQNTTVAGLLNLPGIVTAANCTGQPTKSIIAITGTGVLTQCP